MPKGSSRNRVQESKRGKGNKRGTSRPKGEETTRTRRERQTTSRRTKGEERPAAERAQAVMTQTAERAMRTAERAMQASERTVKEMERRADIFRGEASTMEHQGRKTMIEAIDQAQRLAGQAQQVGAYSIRTSANLAQDWLRLTWHVWDAATDTVRSVVQGGMRVLQRVENQRME